MFAAQAQTPGGVNGELRLWLRADDIAALRIENLPSTNSRLQNYPFMDYNNKAPAVLEWRDRMNGHTYLWAAGPSEAAHRIPVYGNFATFYNNVAAVIRDDAAGLLNKQSHSTHL